MDPIAGRPSFLCFDARPRLLLFGGKGGVGKTTCATTTGLAMARALPDRSLALVSADPAHSVVDCLEGVERPSNLTPIELDAPARMEIFKRDHAPKLQEIARRGTFFDDEDIGRFLDLSLPGLDELMAFLEIARWIEEDTYDCIIVDTAPTGHTLRLLGMPALLRQWLGALDTFLAKHRYMRAQFAGRCDPDEIDTFLTELTASVDGVEALLTHADRCRFVPVMLAEALSVDETATLVTELDRLGIAAPDIVVNRLQPPLDCDICGDRRTRQQSLLTALPTILETRRRWGVPLQPGQVRGATALSTFWAGASLVEAVSRTEIEIDPPAPRPDVVTSAHVQSAARPPNDDEKLLIFAGKGGVGKTTLACATALRLAGDGVHKRLLLFSTDPAHSLSAALQMPIGPCPTPVRAGLEAMEIDGPAELERLKQDYADELEVLIDALSGGVDLTFDRCAMERMLDLAPPGIDEVMAVTQAIDLLETGRCDALVLDAAPTGHLIRLLEMPEVIDQWLKATFAVFLKYKRIFRLPRLAERLITVSKRLKRLRAMMTDPRQCGIYVVATMTQMVLAETRDLLHACVRIGVDVKTLFVNLATPPGPCSFCRSARQVETEVKRGFTLDRGEWPSPLSACTIHYAGDLRGVPRLAQLGGQIFASSQVSRQIRPSIDRPEVAVEPPTWLH